MFLNIVNFCFLITDVVPWLLPVTQKLLFTCSFCYAWPQSRVGNQLLNKESNSKNYDTLMINKSQLNVQANLRHELKNYSDEKLFQRQNWYGNFKHKTVFANSNGEESSDEEVLPSDDESMISKVKMNIKLT